MADQEMTLKTPLPLVLPDDWKTLPNYVIWSWEHNAWWCPNHAGYTPHFSKAGKYSYNEAAKIVIPHYPAGEEVAVHVKEADRSGRPMAFGKND